MLFRIFPIALVVLLLAACQPAQQTSAIDQALHDRTMADFERTIEYQYSSIERAYANDPIKVKPSGCGLRSARPNR